MNGARAEGKLRLRGAIIARARDGDAAAREELARTHYEFVYRHVLTGEARGASQADAADITQSTFARAFEALDAYKGDGSFRGWLLTIAKRAASDFYRSRRTAPVTVNAATQEDLAAVVEARTPLDDVLRLEEDVRVRRALSKLSADHRKVLAYRIVSELSVQETARMLGRTDAAVKMLQLRAVRALCDVISNKGSGGRGEGT